MDTFVSSLLDAKEWPVLYSMGLGAGAVGFMAVRNCRKRRQEPERVSEKEVEYRLHTVEDAACSDLYRKWCNGERWVEPFLKEKAEQEFRDALAVGDKITVLQLLSQAEQVPGMLAACKDDSTVAERVRKWKRQRYRALFDLFVFSKPRFEVIVLVTLLNSLRPMLWDRTKEESEQLASSAKDVAVHSFAMYACRYWLHSAVDNAISWAIAKLRRWEADHFSETVKKDVLRHLLCLDQSYFDTHKTDLSQFSDDIEKLRYLVTNWIFQVLRYLTITVYSVREAMKSRGQLLVSAGCLCAVPVLVLIRDLCKVVEARIDSATSQPLIRRGKMENQSMHTVSGLISRIHLVRTSVAEEREIKLVLEEESAAANDADTSYSVGERCLEALRGTIIPNAMILFLSCIARYAAAHDWLPGEGINVSVEVALEAFDHISSLCEELSDVTECDYTLRLMTVLTTKPKIDTGQGLEFPPHCGDILLEGVSFCYQRGPGGVLRNVTCRIPAASRTAIIGASGCGKSTLAALLVRLYERTGGVITLGSRDIREYNVRSLRKRVMLIRQSERLPPGNILNAFTYGIGGVPFEAVVEVATMVCLHDSIIQLKDGYNTPLGVGGIMLSGGQVQRVTLARAILSRPSVLILDEATAGLDGHTEAIVMENLISALPDTTILVIAHRLATAMHCKEILCMKDGTVIEHGSYNHLTLSGGETSKLLKAQQSYPSSERFSPVSELM
ncbi:ABC transporter B family member 24 [Diplonema papillatum]|nr:ABC transporter B family member 24 [Diplonema papillatum]